MALNGYNSSPNFSVSPLPTTSPLVSPAITIGFESIEYTVDEGGTLEVVVVKSAPFDSVIEFEVAGGNFSAVRAFPDGASSPDSISIFFQIPDDIIALEPVETISFTLTVLERNPQISVDPDTTTVTILDNDGEFGVYVVCVALWHYLL